MENYVNPIRYSQRSKFLIRIFLQKLIFWQKRLISSTFHKNKTKGKKYFHSGAFSLLPHKKTSMKTQENFGGGKHGDALIFF